MFGKREKVPLLAVATQDLNQEGWDGVGEPPPEYTAPPPPRKDDGRLPARTPKGEGANLDPWTAGIPKSPAWPHGEDETFPASTPRSAAASAFAPGPHPPAPPTQCKMRLMARGLGSFHATYFVFREDSGAFVLAARKRVGATSLYDISADQADSKATTQAQVRANFIGSEFVMTDMGEAPERATDESSARQELVSIIYEKDLLGTGVRAMTIIIPARSETEETVNIRTGKGQSLIERHKAGKTRDILVFHNKAPDWDEESQVYTLNFHGRVKLPSVKNYQVVNDTGDLVLQFGRVTENSFSLDYRYPFSLAQALGVAISSVDNKIACE